MGVPDPVDVATFGFGLGQVLAAGIGGEAGAIEKEVVQRLAPGIHPDLIKLAVQDVF